MYVVVYLSISIGEYYCVHITHLFEVPIELVQREKKKKILISYNLQEEATESENFSHSNFKKN